MPRIARDSLWTLETYAKERPTFRSKVIAHKKNRKLFLGGNRNPVTLPPFTLVGATTDEYLLTASMRDRFKILLRLTHYSDDEIALLISQRAKRMGWEIDPKSVGELATRARGRQLSAGKGAEPNG